MRPFVVAAALAAAAVAAGAAGQGPDRPRLRLAAPALPSPLLAIATTTYGAKLFAVDPRTLAPKPGPRLELGFHMFGWSFSADRTRLALGDGAGRLLVADPRDLRRGVEFDPGGPGGLVASAWDGDRLLTISRSPEGVVARTIDWPRRRVTSTGSARGSVQAFAHAGSSIVLLLAPLRGIGTARLAIVGAGATIRSVALARIRVGTAPIDLRRGPLQVVRHADAGLAVGGGHAYVVAAGAPVADVELASLRLSYHRLHRRSSLAARLGNWLQPAAQAKGAPDGPNRSALWLGGGILAIVGTDDHGAHEAPNRSRLRVTPAGVQLVDTRSWTATPLAPAASRLSLATGTLLVYGAFWDSGKRRETGIGLRALGAEGRERFHVLGAQPIWDVQVVGSRAVVGLSRSRLHSALIDVATGRVLSRARSWPQRFLVGEPFPG